MVQPRRKRTAPVAKTWRRGGSDQDWSMSLPMFRRGQSSREPAPKSLRICAASAGMDGNCFFWHACRDETGAASVESASVGALVLYPPLECGSLEFYAHTIAAVRLRNTIDDSRVLWVLANQGGKQRHITRLPVPAGHHASAVGTDVFRDGPFASPRLFQAGEVDLDGERVAPLNSRVESLQMKNLQVRTAINSLLA